MTLTMYLLGALAAWMPPASVEMRARQESVASDIASVVEDPSEPPLFKGDDHRATTGLLLASLSVMEGGLAKYVDSGECNDVKWRGSHKLMLKAGDCDGGRAYSLWQIHVGTGLLLLPSGGYVVARTAPEDAEGTFVGKQEILSDRANAVRAALHILRQSFSAGLGMCGYTGERGECPKGKLRLDKATSYAKSVPFVMES